MLRKSLVASVLLLSVSVMDANADATEVLSETASNSQDARLEAIDAAATELILLRAALQSYYDGNGFSWPADLATLEASPYWVADMISNYNTQFFGAVNVDNQFVITVDVLQESTALSIAPRAQAQAFGTVVSLTVMAPGTEDIFAGMLHRDAVPGSPELNQMNTDLDMGGFNIVNVGDISGSTLNFVNGSVSEDFTVLRDAFFERNIVVDGVATITELDADIASVDDLTVTTAFKVDGTATFNGQTILNGAVTLNGALSGENATFKDVLLDSITASGLSQFNDGVNVVGGADVTGDFTFDDAYGENLTLSGDISANDAAFSGNLTVDGISNLNDVTASTLSTTGDVHVGGDLAVDGDGIFGGDIQANDITATGNLRVQGDTTLDGALTVGGETTFAEKVTFEGGVDLGQQPLEWANGDDYANIKYEVLGASSNLVIDVGNDGDEDALVIRNNGSTVANFGDTEIAFSRTIAVTGSVTVTDEFRVSGTNNYLDADGLTVGDSSVTNAGYKGGLIEIDNTVRLDTSGGRFYIQPFDEGVWQTGREFGYDNVTNRWFTDGDFNAGGNLYEQGERVATQTWSDNRYYQKNQDVIITKAMARLVLDSPSTGSVSTNQAATFSMGESGVGASSLHLAYQGNGYSYIGMGALGGDNIPDNWAMRMYYDSRDICFKRSNSLSTVCATQLAVKDEVNTFTADQYFAEDVIIDGDLIVKGDLLDANGNPFLLDDGSVDADTLDNIDSLQFLRADEKDFAEEGFGIYIPGTVKFAFNTGASVPGSTPSVNDVELFYDGQLKAYTTADGFKVKGDLDADNVMVSNNIVASNNLMANDAILNGKSVKQFMADCEAKNGICEGGGGFDGNPSGEFLSVGPNECGGYYCSPDTGTAKYLCDSRGFNSYLSLTTSPATGITNVVSAELIVPQNTNDCSGPLVGATGVEYCLSNVYGQNYPTTGWKIVGAGGSESIDSIACWDGKVSTPTPVGAKEVVQIGPNECGGYYCSPDTGTAKYLCDSRGFNSYLSLTTSPATGITNVVSAELIVPQNTNDCSGPLVGATGVEYCLSNVYGQNYPTTGWKIVGVGGSESIDSLTCIK